MIRRDVEQATGIEAGVMEQFELIGGEFKHEAIVRTGRIKAQGRIAEIAARLGFDPGMGEDMGGQGRRGRFAVGAGDRDAGHVGKGGAEQFDIADDRFARTAGLFSRRMRGREGGRDAGAYDQHIGFGPVTFRQIDRGEAEGL